MFLMFYLSLGAALDSSSDLDYQSQFKPFGIVSFEHPSFALKCSNLLSKVGLNNPVVVNMCIVNMCIFFSYFPSLPTFRALD